MKCNIFAVVIEIRTHIASNDWNINDSVIAIFPQGDKNTAWDIVQVLLPNDSNIHKYFIPSSHADTN